MIKPITPREVIGKKTELIPDAVLLAFNETIARTYHNGVATFTQDEIILLIIQKFEQEVNKGLGAEDWIKQSRQQVFDNHWLDVEGIYRKAGWIVEYDKPAYNESYPATCTFRGKL